MSRFWRWFWGLVLGVPAAAFVVWGLADNPKVFLTTGMNGLTLAALTVHRDHHGAVEAQVTHAAGLA